jgi:hypothetical protein
MKKFALLFAVLAGCSESPDISPPTFDGTDPQGSIHRLTVGLSEADIDRFRYDCMVASTGDANLDRADKDIEALPNKVDEAFLRLNGMTAKQIRDRAAEIRAKGN